jgi:hypothetical protein
VTVHAIQAITLNGTQYPGIVGESSNRERKVRKDGSDGLVHRTLLSPIRTAPKASLRALQLKTLVAAMTDSTDILCKNLDGAAGLVLWGAKMDDTKPGYLATSVHRKRTGLRGMICADSIEWSPGNAAEMALSAYFKCTDGTTDPLSDVTNGTLPAQPVPVEALVLASLTRGGNPVTDISRLMIKMRPQDHERQGARVLLGGAPASDRHRHRRRERLRRLDGRARDHRHRRGRERRRDLGRDLQAARPGRRAPERPA